MSDDRSAARLPAFPWDSLREHADVARAHPDGIVDLSVGTPVDPTPDLVQDALRAAANAPGYPLTAGSPELLAAARGWAVRTLGVTAEIGLLPTVGSKELVGLLPTLLGLGPGDSVLHPELAYPTYDVGARIAGASPRPVGDELPRDPAGARLLWLNSPANPTGRVLGVEQLREAVAWGRRHGVLVVSDECYLELGYEGRPVSVLSPEVVGDDATGVLAVHSLSKRSNLAGYRAGLVLGDEQVVGHLLEVRRHAGLIPPAPVQAAAAAALADDAHVVEQRERYAARRALLRPALESAGFSVTHSEAGLYLWASSPALDAWGAVGALAALGVLVAPGVFYGPAGQRHVRVALTATDERVAAAATRLSESGPLGD
jgi:succinyldiaminopimelate transaminase